MEDFDHLVGHRFPGAVVSVPEHFSWLWTDCVGAAPTVGEAHPSVAYLLGLRGTGLRIDEIMALVGATPADDVLLGECGFELRGLLRPDVPYEGSGGILGVERKHGARTGDFDLVSFEVLLRERPGEEVARCSFTWIVPRGGGPVAPR
jgi:hypothetical protein